MKYITLNSVYKKEFSLFADADILILFKTLLKSQFSCRSYMAIKVASHMWYHFLFKPTKELYQYTFQFILFQHL